jgi:hypothetical protein
VDDENPVIWKLIPTDRSDIFMVRPSYLNVGQSVHYCEQIKIYDGGYGRSVWTTSEIGVMVYAIDKEHETQQQFTFTKV